MLDGVRGVAWLTVFASHAGILRLLAAGQVAMFVWFGLSGFLITSLLVEERSENGSIALASFYARRALRLVPALVFFLVVWLFAVALFGHEPWLTTVPGGGSGTGEPFGVALEGAAAALGYLTNWFDIFHVFTGYVPLGHLWSLAVEEQFYLVWAPLLAVLLASRRRKLALVGTWTLAAASFADVVIVRHAAAHSHWVYFGTDTRAGAFLVGAALGLLWSGRPVPVASWVRLTTPAVLSAVCILGLGARVFSSGRPVDPVLYGAAWVGVSLAGPLLVVALVDRPRRSGSTLLTSPVITYTGRRSYALYLWHYVWLTWFRGLGPLGIVAAFIASFASAEISWRVIEVRALALKTRFASRGRRVRGHLTRAEQGIEARPEPAAV